MLSKHPEVCRYPHGHTRTFEVILSSPSLDQNEMVVDFKVIKLAVEDFIERFDHRMAINSKDPLREAIQAVYPDSLVVFEGQDPTTELLAKMTFDHLVEVLKDGFSGESSSGTVYTIAPGRVTVERVRVSETPTSWAEYGF